MTVMGVVVHLLVIIYTGRLAHSKNRSIVGWSLASVLLFIVPALVLLFLERR